MPGAPDWEGAAADATLVGEVRRLAGLAGRTASLCAGAFTLAAAGLLDGRRATTHWELAGALAERYPAIVVDPDPIFIRDGRVITSAGISAGIDLALVLVEEDLGARVARTVAQHLVVFMQRPGGQSQFSVRARAGGTSHEVLRPVLDAVTADPAGEHSLPGLAAGAELSTRHLSRLFRDTLAPRLPSMWSRCGSRRPGTCSNPVPSHWTTRLGGPGSVRRRRCAERSCGRSTPPPGTIAPGSVPPASPEPDAARTMWTLWAVWRPTSTSAW